MNKPKTAVAGLAVLAIILVIGGLIRSRYTNETFEGVNGSGLTTGLAISPFVFVGLLLMALAFGWHKYGR